MSFFGNLWAKKLTDKQHHIHFNKKFGNLVYTSGNVVWTASISSGIACTTFDLKGKKLNQYLESEGIPYRSCPISLLDHAGTWFSNPPWRDSVFAYWDQMNKPIKKGVIYEVVGNQFVDRICVDSISRSNVTGTYFGKEFKISKLQVGTPLKPKGESNEDHA